MYTQKQTGLESRELHAELPTIEVGYSEPIILKGGLHSVIGFKPMAGILNTPTGAEASFVVTAEGDAETAHVETLTIDTAPSEAGDIEISLYGVDVTVTLVGDETASAVAALIRAEEFEGWTLTGADADVIFTADEMGAVEGDAVFTDVGSDSEAATSCKLQTSIDDLAHINSSTAIWKELVGATASGTYVESVLSYPITAVRVETVTAADDSYAVVLVRE